MMQKHRVVVTGVGVVSTFGHSVDEFWRAVRNGHSAIREWQPQAVQGFPVRYAATVDSHALQQTFSHWLGSVNNLERRGLFGLIAARLALQDAGLDIGEPVGVSVCSGVPEVSDEDLAAQVGQNEREAMHTLCRNRERLTGLSGVRCGNDSMAAAIARQVRADGPVLNINGACAGATQAIGLAFHSIRRGETERMLAGGADSVLNLRTLCGLFLLGATATATQYGAALCRPFDKGRSGLVAGEGGAMLLLESEASAKKRGARIYGEVLGYGSSLDAYKVTAPHPEGTGAEMAMANALRDAEVSARKIDYINAHGTSTPLNDVIETQAIKTIFPQAVEGEVKISSTKSVIGHWIAAAGAPEAIATLLAIRHNEIPPTINLDNADGKCDLDYVANRYRACRVDCALSNSFGFGGINASLVLGRYAA